MTFNNRDYCWGTAGNFIYSIVEKKRGEWGTYDVYASPLPKRKIISEDMPHNNLRNRLNETEFRDETSARKFLKHYLMNNGVTKEEAGRVSAL